MKSKFRKGMWVVNEQGKVGVLVDFLDFGNAEVHYTNESGETILVIQLPVSTLKQAAFTDIPAPRRPSLEVARAKGY